MISIWSNHTNFQIFFFKPDSHACVKYMLLIIVYLQILEFRLLEWWLIFFQTGCNSSTDSAASEQSLTATVMTILSSCQTIVFTFFFQSFPILLFMYFRQRQAETTGQLLHKQLPQQPCFGQPVTPQFHVPTAPCHASSTSTALAAGMGLYQMPSSSSGAGNSQDDDDDDDDYDT